MKLVNLITSTSRTPERKIEVAERPPDSPPSTCSHDRTTRVSMYYMYSTLLPQSPPATTHAQSLAGLGPAHRRPPQRLHVAPAPITPSFATSVAFLPTSFRDVLRRHGIRLEPFYRCSVVGTIIRGFGGDVELESLAGAAGRGGVLVGIRSRCTVGRPPSASSLQGLQYMYLYFRPRLRSPPVLHRDD